MTWLMQADRQTERVHEVFLCTLHMLNFFGVVRGFIVVPPTRRHSMPILI